MKESLTKLTVSRRKQLVSDARLKCLERVKKFREKKKQTQSQQDIKLPDPVIPPLKEELPKSSKRKSVQFQHSYKTEASLAKAFTKQRKILPKSPGKQKAVIGKLFYSLDEGAQQEIINNKTKLIKGGKKGIDSELMEKILYFYERDDVSRMSPNAKDSRFYYHPATGEKVIKQKRHLVVTLKQAHDKFLIENAGEYR